MSIQEQECKMIEKFYYCFQALISNFQINDIIKVKLLVGQYQY